MLRDVRKGIDDDLGSEESDSGRLGAIRTETQAQEHEQPGVKEFP